MLVRGSLLHRGVQRRYELVLQEEIAQKGVGRGLEFAPGTKKRDLTLLQKNQPVGDFFP